MRSILRGGLLALAVVLFSALSAVHQGAQAQNADGAKEKNAAINKKLIEAGKLLRENKYEEAKAAVMEADTLLAEFSGMPGTKNAATTLNGTVETIRKGLTSKGVTLPERPKAAAAPAPGTKPATPVPAAGGAGGVSFAKEVAPILVGKCSKCHLGNNKKGDFSANTYNALMQGAKGVKMVEPGNGKGSRLYEVLESGDMPRGGGKLSPAELASIEKWITQGAKFDGGSPNAALSGGVTPAPAKAPAPAVAKASGNEKVSYSRDIAPVLAEQCTGCHGTRQNPGNDLRVNSLTNLLKGGDSGPPVQIGKADASLLIQKIKGTQSDGARMPLRRPPLSGDVIAKFETWVAEGCKFDGPDANMDTYMVGAIYVAKHMSYEELAAKRLETAGKNWTLGNPDDVPEKVETANFNVIGNVIKSRLEEIGEEAEKQHAEMAKYFGVPEGEHLLKGKLTLIVFSRRFEYSEFGNMVEKRNIPKEVRTHWFFNIIDAYACLPPPEDGDSLQSVLVEVIAGAYIDSQGYAPDWFKQGAARVIAAKTDPKATSPKKWDEAIPGILASGGTPDGLVKEGVYSPADAPVVAYGFMKSIVGNKTKFLAVLKALRENQGFDAAFKGSFGDPAQVVAGWARTAVSGGGSKKGKK